MLQVVEINAIEHLEEIRLRWTSLLYQTRGSSFFHTLDWLKVYWRHFRDRQRLRVLLVYRGGTVLGILPLVVREEAMAASPVDVLTYPTIDPSHFHGPIGPNPSATLMATFRHLAGQPRDWDMLSLSAIGEHDHGRTATALQLAGFSAREGFHAQVSKVCFDASWTDAHVRWPSKAVGQPQREGSTILEGPRTAGKITFERLRPLGSLHGDDQPLEGIVEECLELQGRPSLAHSSPETTNAFHRDFVATASRLGMLDLNLLRWEGRLVACSLNVHFDGVIQQICVSQDAESSSFDATAILSLRMLQDSCARKDRCIYFAHSNGCVANLSATRQLPVVRYRHLASMPLRTRLARFGQWLAAPMKNG